MYYSVNLMIRSFDLIGFYQLIASGLRFGLAGEKDGGGVTFSRLVNTGLADSHFTNLSLGKYATID